ncbi:MAG: tyrosine-type recombinase/integrase, partial [bacterium]|nr:tyrosine-type recombinase/integrase [bacterium]
MVTPGWALLIRVDVLSPLSSHTTARKPAGRQLVRKPTQPGRQARLEPTSQSPQKLRNHRNLYSQYQSGTTVVIGITGLSWTWCPPLMGRGHQRLAKRAGIHKRISPHSLCHSFITAALDAGVPLRDVQDAASHSDPRTTMRYDRARHSLDRHATYV